MVSCALILILGGYFIYFLKKVSRDSFLIKIERWKNLFFKYYIRYVGILSIYITLELLSKAALTINYFIYRSSSVNFIFSIINNLNEIFAGIFISILRLKDPLMKKKSSDFYLSKKLNIQLKKEVNEEIDYEIDENFDIFSSSISSKSFLKEEENFNENINYMEVLSNTMRINVIYSMLSGILISIKNERKNNRFGNRQTLAQKIWSKINEESIFKEVQEIKIDNFDIGF